MYYRSGSAQRRSRIVTLSSEAHVPGTINFEDLQSKYVQLSKSRVAWGRGKGELLHDMTWVLDISLRIGITGYGFT